MSETLLNAASPSNRRSFRSLVNSPARFKSRVDGDFPENLSSEMRATEAALTRPARSFTNSLGEADRDAKIESVTMDVATAADPPIHRSKVALAEAALEKATIATRKDSSSPAGSYPTHVAGLVSGAASCASMRTSLPRVSGLS
jgi:hypothetical protein